ncbi:hypothetical protein LOTGIDRAFT_152747 [Lottia gigantea]|uniref:Uncharacterized protein n=1 Tax=Lottia gigantea TaxID=225164 RepID=V4AV06_LOTGI|nr:hypothetical protein LOTGIDRAFT_152747 [Lottia gigantea]ESO97656.1 hypothetical protein LOTGIDRAFT_152747 [Lottia gigantea]
MTPVVRVVPSCETFTSCIENAPSLPGTVTGNIPSFISARDTDRWCHIAKSYVSCGLLAKEKISCFLLTTDVSKIQKTSDNACQGVRDPCHPVSECLESIRGSHSELISKSTCPI